MAITVLALLLERAAEHACTDTWRNIRDRLQRIQLAQSSSPNDTVRKVANPTLEADKCAAARLGFSSMRANKVYGWSEQHTLICGISQSNRCY